MAQLRVIFAGGGTGGHLFPALAIADEIKRLVPDSEVLFIGTKDKLEARIVPTKGYVFKTIWISGFKRRFTLDNFMFPFKVIRSVMQSISIIQNFKPDVVVGTGGYVSGPVVFAATQKRIPTLIHEQNSYPGLTTRLLGKKVSQVCITFESSKLYLKRQDNIVLTGNPTRSILDNADKNIAAEYFGFEKNSIGKTILVFGGSLGAKAINDAVLKSLPEIIRKGHRIIWQTGTDEIDRIKSATKEVLRSSLWVNAFIDRMELAYAISDFVVCRAGATTIAELTRLGKPALLIPYPFAADDHQTKNAKSLVEHNAALMVLNEEASYKLWNIVEPILNDDSKLSLMSKESKKLGMPDAARLIAQRVIAMARR